jgi:hypothetical protein
MFVNKNGNGVAELRDEKWLWVLTLLLVRYKTTRLIIHTLQNPFFFEVSDAPEIFKLELQCDSIVHSSFSQEILIAFYASIPAVANLIHLEGQI